MAAQCAAAIEARREQFTDQMPPAEVPRLFVGNLNARITDAMLRNLISRFGSICSFDRSACASYAHISLQAEQKAVLNCLSCLNNVKWYGAELRVEKAKPYFLLTLIDEWQHQTQLPPVSPDSHPPPPHAGPLQNEWSGKHIRFPVSDQLHVDPQLSYPPEQSHPLVPDTTPSKPPPSKPPPTRAAKSDTLISTITLFGLSRVVPPSVNNATLSPNPRKRARLQPVHPTSTEQLADQHKNYTDPKSILPPRHENNSTGADIQQERKTALAVYNTMFADQHHDLPHMTDAESPTPCTQNTAAPLNPATEELSVEQKPFVPQPEASTVSVQPYSIQSAEAVEQDPSKIDLLRERSIALQIYRSKFPAACLLESDNEPPNYSARDAYQTRVVSAFCARPGLHRKLKHLTTNAPSLQNYVATKTVTTSVQKAIKRASEIPLPITEKMPTLRRLGLHRKLTIRTVGERPTVTLAVPL